MKITKRYQFVILGLLLWLIPHFLLAEDDFNVERLPLGNPDTKWDFCAVKLNQIFDSGQNKHIEFDKFIGQLKNYRVVMVGESHTSDEHHIVQFKVIKGLVEAGKPVVLALEMFNESQNKALQAFIDKKYSKEAFMDSAGWFDSWGYNYRMYQRIFEYAQDNGIKLYGVNIPRDYVSKISMKGLAGLTAEELKQIPTPDTTNIEHEFLIKAYFTGSDAVQPAMFVNKYLAQCVWDAAMGEGAIKAARENPDATVVVLAGSGHVAYNLGIGKIVHKRSGLPVASVIAVDVPPKKEETLMEIMHKHSKRKKEEAEESGTEEKKEMPKMPGKMEKAAMPGKMDKAAMPKMPAAMAQMMEAEPDTTPYKIVVQSLADYLWGVPDNKGKPTYPTLGFRIGEKTEKGFEVNIVFPESIAEENGIENDDIITQIDGKSFGTVNEMKKYLYTKNWNDPISIKLLREEKEIQLNFKLEWDDDQDDDDEED